MTLHAAVILQASFQRLVGNLSSLQYNILDVKSTQWYDDYNSFKAGSKDLEVMLVNVIQLAFDNVSSLITKVELLEVGLIRHMDLPASCTQHGTVMPSAALQAPVVAPLVHLWLSSCLQLFQLSLLCSVASKR